MVWKLRQLAVPTLDGTEGPHAMPTVGSVVKCGDAVEGSVMCGDAVVGSVMCREAVMCEE